MRRGGERTFSRFGYDLSCFLLCVQECCDSLCCENMASERELREGRETRDDDAEVWENQRGEN